MPIDIMEFLKRIAEYCDHQMCYECPLRWKLANGVWDCNVVEFFELLASDDPCHWDFEAIEEVLNRECGE